MVAGFLLRKMNRTQAMPTFTEWLTGLFQPNQKAVSHRPDLANRVHVYSEYSDARTQPEMSKAREHYDVYGSYVWARKAIGKIAENMRSLPVLVYSPDDEPLWDHEVSQVLSRGNDEYSPSQLWEQYVIYLMTTGEAFFEIVPDGRGKPAEMWIRESDRMFVRPDVANMYYRRVAGYLYRPEEAGLADIDFAPEEVIFDKLFNPLNAWRGISPIHAVREGITIDLFSQAYSKTFLKNNARPDFAVTTNVALTDGERQRIEGEFMRRYGGANNWHKPAILDADGGLTVAPFSFAPKDTEWLEQRRFSRDEVGAIFGVPDEIMGYGRDTYENFQTALETFWTLTVKPLCDHRDDVLTHFFRHRRPMLKDGEYIGTDLTGVGVLQEDEKPKIEMAEILVRMGYDLNAVNERFQLGMAELVDAPMPVEVAAIAEQTPQDDEPEDEPMPAKALYLPGPVRDALRSEVTKAIEIRTKLIAGGNFDENRWRMNAEKAFTQWLDNGMARRLVDTLANRSDADALIGAAIMTEDGDAEGNPFSLTLPTLPTPGSITPDWLKAMTLQLDPDDDEAEQLARMAIERRTERQMRQSLEEWLNSVLSGLTEDEVQNIAYMLRNNQMNFRDVLQRALVDSADLGVSVAVNQLETIGYGFDYTLANAEAREWARRYTDDVLAQLNTTNDRIVGEAVARWIDNGEPLQSLVDDLRPYFGDVRARRIAATEVTRAYAEANAIAYQESGVVQSMEWRTANDERVCPICGPLGGLRLDDSGQVVNAEIGQQFGATSGFSNPQFTHPNGMTYGLPPAHPNCRCWVVPVIDEA